MPQIKIDIKNLIIWCLNRDKDDDSESYASPAPGQSPLTKAKKRPGRDVDLIVMDGQVRECETP